MRTRDRILILATIVFLVLAVRSTYHTISVLVKNSRTPVAIRFVDEWNRYLPTGRHLGSDSADVRLLEFVDYSCRACRDAHPFLEEILEHPGYNVSLSVRYTGFQSAPERRLAAIAGLCADEQGSFPAFHRILIRLDSLVRDEKEMTNNLLTYGAQAGLPDTVALKDCLNSRDIGIVLASDSLAAFQLGVRAVPTFIVEGRMFEGVQPQLIRIVKSISAERKHEPE